MKPIKLALAMIVRNESDMLSRTLPCHARDFPYRFAVDTGSTDDTLDVLRDFGFVIHGHPWEWDYAKARNQCLDHCRAAGMTHVLMLDADEAIWEDQAETLIKTIEHDLGSGPVKPLAYSIPRINLSGSFDAPYWDSTTYPDSQPRVFSLDHFEYCFPLHEWLAWRATGRQQRDLTPLSFPAIFHYGNCKPIKQRWLIHHNYALLKEGKEPLLELPAAIANLTEDEFKAQTAYCPQGELYLELHPLSAKGARL